MTDQELVQKLTQGDEKALFELYNTYKKPLFQFIYKRLRDSALTEEILQDVFINSLESLRDFRFQSSVKTFIYTIARNKIIDHIRRKKIKKVLFSTLPSYIVESLTQVDFNEEIEKKELQEKLEQTFSELPHEYQVILRLKYIEDKSVEFIAETLVKTFKSTESLLFRARKAFIKTYSTMP
ncbi:RNA polymerase sigma factor [soil metagenome]